MPCPCTRLQISGGAHCRVKEVCQSTATALVGTAAGARSSAATIVSARDVLTGVGTAGGLGPRPTTAPHVAVPLGPPRRASVGSTVDAAASTRPGGDRGAELAAGPPVSHSLREVSLAGAGGGGGGSGGHWAGVRLPPRASPVQVSPPAPTPPASPNPAATHARPGVVARTLVVHAGDGVWLHPPPPSPRSPRGAAPGPPLHPRSSPWDGAQQPPATGPVGAASAPSAPAQRPGDGAGADENPHLPPAGRWDPATAAAVVAAAAAGYKYPAGPALAFCPRSPRGKDGAAAALSLATGSGSGGGGDGGSVGGRWRRDAGGAGTDLCGWGTGDDPDRDSPSPFLAMGTPKLLSPTRAAAASSLAARRTP